MLKSGDVMYSFGIKNPGVKHLSLTRTWSLLLALALPSIGFAAQVMPTPGFNLGKTLEATWGYTPPTQALINSISAAGFKTLRVPCAWYYFSTNGTTIDASVTNFTINAAFMQQVANVVD